MRLALKLCLFFLFFLYPPITFSSTPDGARPKLGIALSGGGARGLAHIGVLKALEELQVPIDYIAGTSMGSIVGGLYALGLSPEELEKEVLAIDWEKIFDEQAERDWLSFRTKREQRLYFLNLELGLDKEYKLTSPTGAIADEELLLTLKRLTRGVEMKHFSELPIPFRAVATDLNKAESVALDSGDLALAMRASMAVPLVFSPVELNGRILVDGGALNNLPVDTVREMGADVVIAVDIATPLKEVQTSSSIFSISQQSLSVVLLQNTRKALQQADLVVTPDLRHIGAGDFTSAGEAIQYGYEAVKNKAVLFGSLARSRKEFDRYLSAQRKAPLPIHLTPQFVEFKGQKRVSEAVLLGQVGELTENSVKTEDLESASRRLMALDDFQQVHYRIVEDEQHWKGVVFEVKEKFWGPHYFRFGFNAQSVLNASKPSFNVLFKHEWLNVNRLSAEWHNYTVLGTDAGVATEFFQPLEPKRRYFIAPYARYLDLGNPIFLGRRQIAQTQSLQFLLGADVGRRYGHDAEFRLGLVDIHGRESVAIGDPILSKLTFKDRAAKFSLIYDSLDDRIFARKGVLIEARSLFYGPPFSTNRYIKSEIYGRSHIQIGKNGSLIGDLRFNQITGRSIPHYETFLLGGYNNFAGFFFGERRARSAAIGRIGGMIPVTETPLRIQGDFRILGFAHAGTISQSSVPRFNQENIKIGLTGAAIWDSSFGTILLGAGYTKGGRVLYYLSIGNVFDEAL